MLEKQSDDKNICKPILNSIINLNSEFRTTILTSSWLLLSKRKF